MTIEPLRETAHGALIRAHLAQGNRAEAARQLQRLAQLLDKELAGEKPSAMVTDMLPTSRSGHAAVTVPVAPSEPC